MKTEKTKHLQELAETFYIENFFELIYCDSRNPLANLLYYRRSEAICPKLAYILKFLKDNPEEKGQVLSSREFIKTEIKKSRSYTKKKHLESTYDSYIHLGELFKKIYTQNHQQHYEYYKKSDKICFKIDFILTLIKRKIIREYMKNESVKLPMYTFRIKYR